MTINNSRQLYARRRKRREKRRKRKRWFKRIRFLIIIMVVVSLSRWISNSLPAKTWTQNDQSAVPIKVDVPKDTAAMDALKGDLEGYIKKFDGQYGIYYYNIATGEEFGINDVDEYTAASTIKAPLNLYLYTKIKSGAVDPQGVLTYLKDDYEEGTGQIRYEKVGKTYTVDELSKLSIELSDNVASNMLIRFLGIENIKQYMRQVGGVVVQDEQNISCPKDMGLYMRLIYDFYSKEGDLGQKLMDCFLNTQFNDKIPALLPKDVKVAHKIGNQVGVVNDVGIVFADSPYVLAVMSKDANEEEAAEVIPNISKKVYDYVDALKK